MANERELADALSITQEQQQAVRNALNAVDRAKADKASASKLIASASQTTKGAALIAALDAIGNDEQAANVIEARRVISEMPTRINNTKGQIVAVFDRYNVRIAEIAAADATGNDELAALQAKLQTYKALKAHLQSEADAV